MVSKVQTSEKKRRQTVRLEPSSHWEHRPVVHLNRAIRREFTYAWVRKYKRRGQLSPWWARGKKGNI